MRSIFDLNFIFVRSDIFISWRYVRSMFPFPNSSLAWCFFLSWYFDLLTICEINVPNSSLFWPPDQIRRHYWKSIPASPNDQSMICHHRVNGEHLSEKLWTIIIWFKNLIKLASCGAGSFLSDGLKTSVLFQGSAHFQHLDLVPNDGFQKCKNTNSVILHKLKSNQVSHGAWSVVNI